MTFSPMQNELVTREEFGEFREEVVERFDNLKSILGDKIDDFRKEANLKFNSLESKMDAMSVQITLLTKTVN